jgi:cytochrome b subunit of formate dehydrogenase
MAASLLHDARQRKEILVPNDDAAGDQDDDQNGQRRLALLVHALAAVTIICVWIVHVYAAIWMRGTISAMTCGQVTGGGAWKHHRKWLRELVTGKTPDRNAGTKAAL